MPTTDRRGSLSAAKAAAQPGTTWAVTNHYITREDHAGFGTTQRRVERVTGSRVYFENGSYLDWPKAAQVERDDDGTIRLFGGGVGQQPADLFVTLRPTVSTQTAPHDPGDYGRSLLFDGDHYAAGARLVCLVCDGRGWLRQDPDGDETLAWVERCGACQHFECDDEAAVAASEATGFPLAHGVPPARDYYAEDDLNRERPLRTGPAHAFLLGANPAATAADLVAAHATGRA